MPSLTMFIVCGLLGVGTAYAFFRGIHNQGARYWLLIPLVMGLFFFVSLDVGEGVIDAPLRSVFVLALFVGLASTPLDD